MGWERHERGGPYYTRSRRVGGRVVREYVGGGLIGELAAELDAEERRERRREAEARRADEAAWAELDGMTAELGELVDGLAAAALLLAGFHRHDRGEWRRKRGGWDPDGDQHPTA